MEKRWDVDGRRGKRWRTPVGRRPSSDKNDDSPMHRLENIDRVGDLLTSAKINIFMKALMIRPT
ncbi:hypothetical protein DBV15_02138, partial [Temnothorax longispinosus]